MWELVEGPWISVKDLSFLNIPLVSVYPLNYLKFGPKLTSDEVFFATKCVHIKIVCNQLFDNIEQHERSYHLGIDVLLHIKSKNIG